MYNTKYVLMDNGTLYIGIGIRYMNYDYEFKCLKHREKNILI